MKQLKLALTILAGLAGAACTLGQPALQAAAKPAAVAKKNPYANPDPAKYMFENELKPGMTGYGLTVMHGVKIQKFIVAIRCIQWYPQPNHAMFDRTMVRLNGDPRQQELPGADGMVFQ